MLSLSIMGHVGERLLFGIMWGEKLCRLSGIHNSRESRNEWLLKMWVCCEHQRSVTIANEVLDPRRGLALFREWEIDKILKPCFMDKVISQKPS